MKARRLPEPAARELYERLIVPLRATARTHGYALAVHGSLARDIDLIAVPWRHDAAAPAVLVEAVRATAEDITGYTAYTRNDPKADPCDFTRRSPEPKFHGRLAWSIHVKGRRAGGYQTYIDISVMPPYADAIERYHAAIEAIRTETHA
jgi:hypothetical protein